MSRSAERSRGFGLGELKADTQPVGAHVGHAIRGVAWVALDGSSIGRAHDRTLVCLVLAYDDQVNLDLTPSSRHFLFSRMAGGAVGCGGFLALMLDKLFTITCCYVSC